jgi:hypothetical protein
MLTTLLESRSRRVRDNRGAAASITLHAAIIFAAVYATATGPLAKSDPVNPSRLHWVTPAAPSITPPLRRTDQEWNTSRVLRAPAPISAQLVQQQFVFKLD